MKILESYIERSIIFEASNLTREDILSNSKRKAIYDFISHKPGIYYYQIIKKLDGPSHVVIWHVKILLEFKFIEMIEEINYKIYFSNEVSPEKAKILYYIKNSKTQKILSYIKSNDIGISKTDISKNLNIHPKTIKNYIEILEKHQIIYSIKDVNKILYFLKDIKN